MATSMFNPSEKGKLNFWAALRLLQKRRRQGGVKAVQLLLACSFRDFVLKILPFEVSPAPTFTLKSPSTSPFCSGKGASATCQSGGCRRDISREARLSDTLPEQGGIHDT
jgi:hypothetical protein